MSVKILLTPYSRECAEHISEKYEDVRDRGQELAAREEVISNLFRIKFPLYLLNCLKRDPKESRKNIKMALPSLKKSFKKMCFSYDSFRVGQDYLKV